MSEVVGLITTEDIPAERVLNSAAELQFTQVVVVGMAEDGSFYFASSQGSDAETNYLLQKGIHFLHSLDD